MIASLPRSVFSLLTVLAMSLVSRVPPLFADRAVDALVDQLGAKKFRERIGAEHELLLRGGDSLPAVLSATQSQDPEVRLRAARVLEVLQKKAFIENREKLLDNPWIVPEAYAPGWELFHQLVGDGAQASLLYASILEQEPKLMLSVFQSPADLNRQFERRCADLKNFAAQRSNGKAHPATVAALLLISVHPDCQPSSQSGTVINDLLNDAQFSHAVVQSQPLRSLLEAWIMFDTSTSAQTRLHHAANFKLEAGLFPAREIVSAPPDLSKTLTQNAMLFLALYGGHAEIDLLESKLDDERGVYVRSNKVVQVRDVALLGLLYMSNQNYEDYKFSQVRSDRRYLYAPNFGGFANDELRNAAFLRWEQWRSAHPKTPLNSILEAADGELTLLSFE